MYDSLKERKIMMKICNHVYNEVINSIFRIFYLMVFHIDP